MNAKTYTEVRFFKWKEDEVSVSLRAASASYGGGSEVLIICGEESTETLPSRLTDITTSAVERGGGESEK